MTCISICTYVNGTKMESGLQLHHAKDGVMSNPHAVGTVGVVHGHFNHLELHYAPLKKTNMLHVTVSSCAAALCIRMRMNMSLYTRMNRHRDEDMQT